LSLDLPVVNYTSNKETKEFIEREAAKLDPGFKQEGITRRSREVLEGTSRL
jgi:hypothetical protein